MNHSGGMTYQVLLPGIVADFRICGTLTMRKGLLGKADMDIHRCERAGERDRRGVHSQAAIAIDPGATVGRGRAARRTADLLASTAELAGPTFRYPGQRSAESAHQARRHGGIPISKRLSDDLDGWAKRLRVAPLRSRE
jgi:LDH2 family malate/lactate/ureidoglycolate dehydrogenase